MSIIVSRLSLPPSPTQLEPVRASGVSDTAVAGGTNPFFDAVRVGGNGPASSSSPTPEALRAALFDRVRDALTDSEVVDRSAEDIRSRLLDLWDASSDDPPERVGNPHPPGSRAWFDHGRQTGVWFEVPMAALANLLAGHEIRPDPTQPPIDADNATRRREYEAARASAPEWAREHIDPFVPTLDVREPGVRSFEQEVVLSHLLQLSRASAFITRAAAAGAEPSQLAALAEAALRRDRLDLHVGDDIGDRLESSNGFDRDAGRSAVANQAFWLQIRAGQKDFSFGNVHDLLPVAPPTQFRRFAQDSRIRLNVDAAGDRMMKELAELARSMDLDVHDEPRKRRERVAAAISGFQRAHAFELVRLARTDGGPDALEALDRELRHLLDLTFEDLEGLGRYVG